VLLWIVHRIHTLTATPRQSGRTIRQGESDCAQRLERQDLPTRSINDLEPAPAQVRAIRQSSVQERANTSSRLLVNRSINTSKSLAVRFGCERLEPLCDRILQRYKSRFLERLSSGSGRASTSADFSHPKFLAAAFLHSCRALKVPLPIEPCDGLLISYTRVTVQVRIAKEQVLDVLNVSSAELLPVR